jgi:hypothetical protein
VEPPAIKQADPAYPAAAPTKRHRRRGWILAGFAILVLGTAAVAFRQTRPTAFDRFWAPVLEGKSVVQICIGQPAELYSFRGERKSGLDLFFSSADAGDGRRSQVIFRSEVAPVAGRYLWRRDAFCMASLAGMLGARGKPFRLRNDSDAPYSELRGSPLIMIGAFDWRRQIRLTTRRFGFGQARVDGVEYKYVRDSQKPEDLRWKFPLTYATQEATGYYDYAIITRELMSNSEKPVISAVGATDYSTLAAGEFLVNPSYVADALRNAPANWHAKNIQVVIRTRIIQGPPGPPSAVATHFW